MAVLSLSDTLPLVVLGFFGLGASQSGYQMGTQTIVLEFGDRDDMPMRIAAATTAEAITATLGPLVGGFVAEAIGLPWVFGATGVLLVAALVLLLGLVREPRAVVSTR
ncbi:MFS transporter [Qipengyuania sp. YG27]|uniref:MFS transporter n=1 Tax=Qipengyuania mesophila TaxID=2867246 RepID=A0ABS7JX77_9SPHN|nr:MFS transporter [Qipengyuania mesophila]